MNDKWKKVVRGVEAVHAFDSLEKGGVQKPDLRYQTQGRVGPPSEPPPPDAQYQSSEYGQNASYYNGHPQSNFSSPFGASATQSTLPFQHSPPPQQALQYSPQASPPQQYSSPVADYRYTQSHSTYGVYQNTTSTNHGAPMQGSSPLMENYNTSGSPQQGQHRGYDAGGGGSPGAWSSPGTEYDSYRQSRPDNPQRSTTMYEGNYPQQYGPGPGPGSLFRSATVPTSLPHNCAQNLSTYDSTCLVCHPPYPPS